MITMHQLDPSPVAHAPTERDFHSHWSQIEARAGTEPALAVLGGAAADRLAWVFMSGYQAAVRLCFPEARGPGWVCYAAAEPEDGPGCALTAAGDGYRLNGRKSWIAGAERVERLVVNVDDGQGRRFALVPRDAPGVTITLPRTPGFLAELSQGAAAFENVRVAAADLIAEPERLHGFRSAEPLCVLLALNGCMAAHARLAGHEATVSAALAAVQAAAAPAPDLYDREAMKAGLTALRERTREVLSGFEQAVLPAAVAALRASWQRDGRLLAMFGVAAST